MTFKKLKFFALSAVALLLPACAEKDILEPGDGTLAGGEGTVTLEISLEEQSAVTRAEGDEVTFPSTPGEISDGTGTDLLIFAVYEVTADGNGGETYRLAPEFQRADAVVEGVTLSTGQNALSVAPGSWPVKIKLTMGLNRNYRVVCWAQNKNFKRFDTSNLENVKIDYTGAINNDLASDAFCAVSEIINGNATATRHIVLRRPFAQINFGTSGWDYEGAAVLKPDAISYLQTRVTVKGVAQYYDVLRGRAITQDAAGNSLLTNATFSLNRMPAFMRVANNMAELLAIPDLDYKVFPEEELLYVDLNKNGKFYPYVSWADYLEFRDDHEEEFNAGVTPATEIYKYLSMCYVLVPNARHFTAADNIQGEPTYGAILDEVKIEAYGKTASEGIGELLTLKNVPVMKNWRTNILSNRFFILQSAIYVHIVPEYCGDYDNYGGTTDGWMNGLVLTGNSGRPSFTGNPYENPEFNRYWDNYYYGKPMEEDDPV